jgi:anaerobic magnesium-protoporphyrin IX monomethyl ester cyclase
MKIVIVMPKYNHLPYDVYTFPVGLGYISAALKNAGHAVICVNCNHSAEEPAALVERTVSETSAQACLTGGLSPYLPQIREIFAAARRANPTITNVAGGGVLSSDPEAMHGLMDIDAGVIGEGERTIVDLCDAFEHGRDLNTVPGIVFRDNVGTAVRTASRDSIVPADLGTLPWVDYVGFGFEKIIERQRSFDNYLFHMLDQPRAIDMITSRSCPYRCTFCFHPSGKIYRERPLDDFFAELDYLVEQFKINCVVLVDELFSLKKARLFEFCARIKPYGLQWIVQLHVNVADRAVLDAMSDAGCTYISYGVESMSAPILLSMQKGSKVERIDAVLKSTYDARIGIQGNLIFGDTAETLATANESMSWWAHHREYMVNTNRLQVYPGSPDYIEAVRDGLITDRGEFIDNLDIDLNISQLNDINLRMISLLTGTASKTLLRLAPIVSFESDFDVPLEKMAYRIIWDCPRCDGRNDYRNVDLAPPIFRRSVRLSCRSCRSRFDVENRIRRTNEEQPLYEENQIGYALACADLAAGNVEAGVEGLAALTRHSPWYHPAHTALAHHYLERCENSSHPTDADEMAVVLHFGLAVLENPFEPELHLSFARALMRKGAYGMARLHIEQALALDAQSVDATKALSSLHDANVDASVFEIYFPSFSDAPIPLRRQAQGYVRSKREKEFPDIAAIERDVRERLHASV